MNDRDTFAAAALTGLIANEGEGPSLSGTCQYAYRIADAMLAVRDSRIAKETNHDAAPAARASVESVAPQPTTRGDSARTDKAAPRPSEGTSDTPPPHTTPPQGSVPGEGSVPDSGKWNEPVAWVAWFDFEDKPDADFLFRNKEQADCWCRKRGADSVPLYPHPAPAVTAEPVAWWVRGPAWWPRGTEYDTGCEYEFVSLVRESADAAAKEGGTVTPLYRHPQPTLTDEEREAVEIAARCYHGARPYHIAATLRGLLERLGGGE